MVGTNAYQVSGNNYTTDGPCITSFELIGSYAVTACQRVGPADFILQGVSLPAELKTNHFLFGRLEEYARKVPKSIQSLFPDITAAPEYNSKEKLILNNRGKVYF